MAEYNPSKIIKDGNTYNFRDDTKIPLAGSNQISGSLIPSTDGTVNLGSVSYQWNNAYIKSLTINGVECGDILTHNVSEFADVSSNQTIGGTKTFSNEVTGFGRDISLMSRLHYGKNSNPSATTWQYLMFTGNMANEGYTNNWYGGYIEHCMYIDGSARGRWLIQNTSEKKAGIQLSQNADGSSSSLISIYSDIALGTSNNKWKDVNTNAINGLNPGALSLPSTLLSAMIQIDTTSWILDGETDVEYTPLGDGYLTLTNNQNLEWVNGQIPNDNNYGIYRFTYKYDSDLGGIQGVTIPCIKGKKVIMKIKGTGFYNALFTYCQGNV